MVPAVPCETPSCPCRPAARQPGGSAAAADDVDAGGDDEAAVAAAMVLLPALAWMVTVLVGAAPGAAVLPHPAVSRPQAPASAAPAQSRAAIVNEGVMGLHP